MTYAEILKTRGLDVTEVKLPLWKLKKITDAEYKAMKETLQSNYRAGRFDKCGKTLVLFCAEWWKREYNGGNPSYEQLARSIGIPQNCINAVIIQGLDKLNIKPIRINNNQYFLRTALLQGGLPQKCIMNETDGLNRYTNFLRGLMREVKQYGSEDYKITSEDVKDLPVFTSLPKTFQNDSIADVSIEIINAVLADDMDALPFDATETQFQTLVSALQAEKQKPVKKESNVAVIWELTKSSGKISLNYRITFPKKLTFDSGVTDASTIKIYVNDRYATSYKLDDDGREVEVFQLCGQPEYVYEWSGEPQLFIQVVKRDRTEIKTSLFPTFMSPDFDSPLVFAKSNANWILGGKSQEGFVVVFDENWKVKDSDIQPELVKIRDDKELYWLEYQDSITLTNGDDEYVCDTNCSDYAVDFRFENIDWLEDANYNIITKPIDYKFFKVYRKTEDGTDIVPRSKYGISYRQYREKNWIKYQNQPLPNGWIELKVVFPDGKYETKKFYHIAGLKCELKPSQNKGSITFTLPDNCKICSKENVGLTTNQQGNTFSVIQQQGATSFSDTCEFSIEIENNPPLKIQVLSPIHCLMIVRNGKNIDYSEIRENALFEYRLVYVGDSSLKIQCSYVRNSTHKPVVINIQEKKLRKTLDLLIKQQINLLFSLYGYDDYGAHIEVRIGNRKDPIIIKRYFITSRYAGKILSITSSTTSRYDNNDGVLFIPVDVPPDRSDRITVGTLERIENKNKYVLPQGIEDKKVIVFSPKYKKDNTVKSNKILPKFYDFGKDSDLTDQERKENQKNSIKRLANSLLDKNYKDDIWQCVVKYYDIAIEYDLPFSTFNCFSAIAGSQELMIRFFICLIMYEMDIYQLAKFEIEFAFDFHWVKKGIWSEQCEKAIEKYPDKYNLLLVLEKLSSLLENTTDIKFRETFLNYIIQENCTDNQNPILPPEINDLCGKIKGTTDDNEDLPLCKIITEKKYEKKYFDVIDKRNDYVTCLLSPVKVAENIMGISDDLWGNSEDNIQLRRTINYYRDKTPDVYYTVLCRVIRQISNNQNSRRQ